MSWKTELFKQVDSLLNEKLLILINEYLELKSKKIDQIISNKLATIIEILIVSLNDQMDFSFIPIIKSKSAVTPIFIRKNQADFDIFLEGFIKELELFKKDIKTTDLTKIYEGFLINLACKVLISVNKKSQTIKLVFDQLNINNEQFESKTFTNDENLIKISQRIIEISSWALFAQRIL
ncbi:hypothetical protein [Spiroplasma endosymbiont of Panorpa germanica]|uniref:hypothetical protein n=1 Tax=Spiroplasma endosymbiont of Panorpa germanica TaxID=3066314 RepID=UPI0030CC693F